MDHHKICGYVAGAIMLLGMIPYVYSVVVTKETKLNRATWAIWAAIGFVNLSAFFSSGERDALWVAVTAVINPSILFLLSLWFGEKQWYKTDLYCLCLAGMALAVWVAIGPTAALIAGLTADALGVWPTLIKIIRDPKSENLLSWVVGFAASVVNAFAVREWTVANSAYVIYSLAAFGLLVWLIAAGQKPWQKWKFSRAAP